MARSGRIYRAALVGCSRMGAFIDHEAAAAHLSPHAGAYHKCERTDLVAVCDVREEARRRAGERWGVPEARRYTDYREMVERERPDILSVATQPEQRAEIVVLACEQGVPAIYAEKAMAASLAEADRMVAAVEGAGVAFNLGTNRRLDAGYGAMRSLIESGSRGRLRSLIHHSCGPLFNSGSHSIDLVLHLRGDTPLRTVQGSLTRDVDIDTEAGLIRADPTGQGVLEFEDGVPAYLLNSGRGHDVDAVLDGAVASSWNGGREWRVRVAEGAGGQSAFVQADLPDFEVVDTAVALVRDLVATIDGDHAPRGGVRTVRAHTEAIFALIESHLRGGARVELPLSGSDLRLERDLAPRQPSYDPSSAAASYGSSDQLTRWVAVSMWPASTGQATPRAVSSSRRRSTVSESGARKPRPSARQSS